MIPGIDVSHWQGEIDWPKVREAGVEFAYIKLTEGLSSVDALFESNWKAAKEAGVIRGAYHFVTADSIDGQIEFFLKNVPSDTDLPPCFDFEYTPLSSSNPTADDALACVCQVPWMVLYASPDWISGKFAITPPVLLWIANYHVVKPRIHPWSKWTFWQHSDQGKVPGINGDVDLDWFNGTIEELQRLPVTGV